MKLTTTIALCLGVAQQALAFQGWIDSTIAHTGEPVGKEIDYDGLTLYVSKAKHTKKKTAVIYLTDVFGINLTANKLLADSFARADFFTIAPDLFDGEPAPEDLNAPGFNATEFLLAHGPDVADPKIEATIAYAKEKCADCKIALTGYCYGGRFAFRFVADGKGGDVAFAAHPSGLEDDEVLAITGPASVAAAEEDSITPAERRRQIEDLLLETEQPYQMALYSGTQHGFGVRANISDPEQKFGKETAFVQAVHWFNTWA
ncbi:alpha/beta-hydrolase [Sarocladium strictum]